MDSSATKNKSTDTSSSAAQLPANNSTTDTSKTQNTSASSVKSNLS